MRRRLVRHPYLWGVALALSAALFVVVIVVAIAGNGGEAGDDGGRPPYPYPAQRFADQGQDHLAPGETFDGYNSDPPTSGPHAPRAAPWGVSDEPLPKEVPVHNMEHGGVIVWYNCDGGPEPLDEAACRQLIDDLAGLVEEAVARGKEVLMTPYGEMDQRIALTAWQHLDAFDELDGARVRAFLESFERRFNPEGF